MGQAINEFKSAVDTKGKKSDSDTGDKDDDKDDDAKSS
jgi:Sec-independent protein translocase protein TatA